MSNLKKSLDEYFREGFRNILRDKKSGKISDTDIEMIVEGLIFCFNCGVKISIINYGGAKKYRDKYIILCRNCYGVFEE